MKRLLWLAMLVMLATPALAQDDFDFGGALTGADLEALLGGGGRGGRGGRGGNNFIPDPNAMYNQVRDLLKTNKVQLEKSQEKPLKTLLEDEVKAMQAFLEEQFGNRGNNNDNRGRGNNNNNQLSFLIEIDKSVVRHNTEMLAEMKPSMTPDQVNLVNRAEKDKKVCLVMLDFINLAQLRDGGGRGGDFLRDLPERPGCTSRESTTAQRLAPLAEVLSKGRQPLTTEQETKFAALIEGRLSKIEEELTAQNPQAANMLNTFGNQNRNNNNNSPQQIRNNIVNTVLSQLGVQNNNNNQAGRGGRGNRGGGNDQNQGRGGRGGNNNDFNPQAEMQKRSDELLDKVVAMLNPDQKPVILKFKYDMLKERGGVERFRAILEEEGTPMTPEQATQVQALLNTEYTALRQYAEQLVDAELKNLPPEALQPPPQQNQQQNNNNNRNQNNPNQNPALAQIVGKILPQVSVRRAILQKATLDTILTRVFTPPQVASYKLNTL